MRERSHELSDEGVDRLSALLSERGSAMNVEMVDGFFAALSAIVQDLGPRNRALLRKRDGGLHERMTRPDVDDMIRLDPSEAVRSGELYALLKANFTLVEDLALGGTLLNLVFYGDVVNNFDPDNESHNRIIREAFALERRLIDNGALGSDFRLIVARPLSSGLAP